MILVIGLINLICLILNKSIFIVPLSLETKNKVYYLIEYFSVYTRALEACGLEFRSDKLWVEFIDWEIANGEIDKAMILFDVLLLTPTALYASHFEKYE